MRYVLEARCVDTRALRTVGLYATWHEANIAAASLVRERERASLVRVEGGSSGKAYRLIDGVTWLDLGPSEAQVYRAEAWPALEAA